MISRKLIALLVVSTALAWLTSRTDSEPVFSDARLPAESVAGQASVPLQPLQVTEREPWRRVIELPSVEITPEPEPEPVFEPPPLPVIAPPPPIPPPSAPPLPIQYLGKLQQADNVALYIRYQGRAQSIGTGEQLDDLYRLDRINQGYALFRYLPMDLPQELRWDAEP